MVHTPTPEEPLRYVCQRCGKAWVPLVSVDPEKMVRVCRVGEPQHATAVKKMPSLLKRVWNLAKALADFVADGCQTVSAEEYAARLAVCDGCELRNGSWCSHSKCGCLIAAKAKGRAWKCPTGKWE
jgi:hypothetical protein